MENKPDEKVKAIKKVDIGEGVIDYKLVITFHSC